MSRLKKGSGILETARRRLAGLKSITPPVDLGAQLTIPIYETEAASTGDKLDAYNQALATVDKLLNEFQTEEGDGSEPPSRHPSDTPQQRSLRASVFRRMSFGEPPAVFEGAKASVRPRSGSDQRFVYRDPPSG